MLKRAHRAIALLAAAPLLLVLILLAFGALRPRQQQVPLSTLLRLAAGHSIASAVIDSDGTVHATTRAGRALMTPTATLPAFSALRPLHVVAR